jgi:hypothetical protein
VIFKQTTISTAMSLPGFVSLPNDSVGPLFVGEKSGRFLAPNTFKNIATTTY